MPFPAARFLPAAALLVLTAWPTRAAADAAGEALRLVPPGTTICVVVRDLRGHVRAVAGSPFAAWAQGTALGKRSGEQGEVRKLRDVTTFLAGQLGATPDELLDDVFGDAVVFAYQPGPAGKPDEEAGVVLVHARKPAVLAAVLGKLNGWQTASGELKAVREKTHRGRTYFEREKAAGGGEYYALRDGLFAYSGQERAIRGVIDRDLDAPPTATDPGRVATALKALGVANKLAACWFDPRGFDGELKAKAAAATAPSDKAFLSQFAQVWAATDAVALSADVGTGVELGVIARVAQDRLPKEIRDVLPTAAGEAGSPWPAPPDHALAAAGGRVSVPRLLAAVKSFLPAAERDKLTAALTDGLGPLVGKDKLAAVLAGVGPHWSVWVTPPYDTASLNREFRGRLADPPEDPASPFPAVTAAVQLSGRDPGRLVRQAVDFAVQHVRVDYNRKHADQIDLAEEKGCGGVMNIKSLTAAALPPGIRPSYHVNPGGLSLTTWSDGALVVGSSPDAVSRFCTAAATTALTAAPPDGPYLRVSATRLRAHLAERKALLAAAVAKWTNRPAADVERDLTDWIAGLEFFDRIEVRLTSAGGVVNAAVTIDFAKPLKQSNGK